MDIYERHNLACYQMGFQEGQLKTIRNELIWWSKQLGEILTYIETDPDRVRARLEHLHEDIVSESEHADPDLWRKYRQDICIAKSQEDARD